MTTGLAMTRSLQIAFWAAALFAFTMAIVPQAVEVPGSDKVLHMLAFFVITSLGCGGYPRFSRVKLMLALAAFGGAIELVQMIPAIHRDAEWGDWLADIVAILAALAGARWFGRRRIAD